jgi:peptidoglycan-associated lipoprotein
MRNYLSLIFILLTFFNSLSLYAHETVTEVKAFEEELVIYFQVDSTEIDSKYFDILKEHADYLRNSDNRMLIIEGHTDQRGTREYNSAKGERMAKAVKSHLESLGVDSSRITTLSYGEEKPASIGDSDQDMAANRRAVLVYQ